MKKLILLLICILPAGLSAQKKSSDINRLENVYAGIHWGPDFMFLKNEGNTDKTNYNYQSKYSQTLGLEIAKVLNDRFLFSTGINFSRRSYTRADVCLTCDVDYTPFSQFHISYTEIPLSMSYIFVNERMDVLGTIGLTNGFRRKVAQEIVSYRGDIETFNSANDFTPYLLSMQAGIGFNYTINTNLFWGMNVLYKQPLNKFSERPELAFYSVGFNTAFYYKF